MNMGTSTMSGMAMSMTSTASAAAATSTMSMSMGGSSSCKISMLWNWYTVDACFLAETWHITSSGMFAGSCIGVILLVVLLDFLRRLGRDYDAYLRLQYAKKFAIASKTINGASATEATALTAPRSATFRPTIVEQSIRALLHMLQFAVAYFVMLLAMYFNGYIIICIFIGAYIGFFIFGWEKQELTNPNSPPDATAVTGCCG